jgi:hypothetical protein
MASLRLDTHFCGVLLKGLQQRALGVSCQVDHDRLLVRLHRVQASLLPDFDVVLALRGRVAEADPRHLQIHVQILQAGSLPHWAISGMWSLLNWLGLTRREVGPLQMEKRRLIIDLTRILLPGGQALSDVLSIERFAIPGRDGDALTLDFHATQPDP